MTKVEFEWEREVGPLGCDEDYEYPLCIVTATVGGSTPAHYGSLTYAGHPAEGPDIDHLTVTMPDGSNYNPTQDEVTYLDERAAEEAQRGDW